MIRNQYVETDHTVVNTVVVVNITYFLSGLSQFKTAGEAAVRSLTEIRLGQTSVSQHTASNCCVFYRFYKSFTLTFICREIP